MRPLSKSTLKAGDQAPVKVIKPTVILLHPNLPDLDLLAISRPTRRLIVIFLLLRLLLYSLYFDYSSGVKTPPKFSLHLLADSFMLK